MLKGKFSEFAIKTDESVAEMFNRLNDIVNDLKILGFEVPDDMFKKSQDEAHGGEIDVKKKSVAFKAQDSKNEEESGCQEEE